MKSLAQIRRERLTLLVQEYGTAANLARKTGKDRRQISVWMKASGEPGQKNMRDETAREIERACKKPAYWLDTEQFIGLSRKAYGVSRLESDPTTLTPAVVAEAEKWVRVEEGSGLQYGAIERAQRLLELCTMIQVDGGTLSPSHVQEMIDAALVRRERRG